MADNILANAGITLTGNYHSLSIFFRLILLLSTFFVQKTLLNNKFAPKKIEIILLYTTAKHFFGRCLRFS